MLDPTREEERHSELSNIAPQLFDQGGTPHASPRKRLRMTYDRLNALVELHPQVFAEMLSRTKTGRSTAKTHCTEVRRPSTADAACQASPEFARSPPARSSDRLIVPHTTQSTRRSPEPAKPKQRMQRVLDFADDQH